MFKKLIRRKIQKKLLSYLVEFTNEKAGLKDYQNTFEEFFNCAIKGMNIGHCDINTNGEKLNLKKLIDNDNDTSLIIFDVGANFGGYTKEILTLFPERNILIHAFEPSESNFKILQNKINNPRVKLNQVGLSDREDKLILYKDKEESSLASLYNRRLEHFELEMSKKEEVTLTTLDKYCLENNIDKINFLKLDIEGHEIQALKGATEMLKNNRIKAIQFEFGGCNIDSRTYFQDFWYLLKDQYAIYRIVRDGLHEIKSYREQYEIFRYSNFLAILKEDNQ